jgi:hypothetical protein
MDPMSALSVASSVITFVDFTSRLATSYFEVSSSVQGQPPKVARLEAAASELASIASTAQAQIKTLGARYPRHADSLDRLASECVRIQEKLDAALLKLTAAPTSKLTHRGSKVLVVVRSMWSDMEFEEWGTQLDRIRDQMMMSVLMCVW